jgi:hypothetical protein
MLICDIPLTQLILEVTDWIYANIGTAQILDIPVLA